MQPITEFRGDNFFLSNFYPNAMRFNGIVYPTAEHAFQAAKCVNDGGRFAIAAAKSPAAAKALGRKVTMRSDWESVKLSVMYQVVHAKFYGDYGLAKKLLATENAVLIENNLWGDTYWGVCGGQGQNHLGRTLMAVRGAVETEGWFN